MSALTEDRIREIVREVVEEVLTQRDLRQSAAVKAVVAEGISYLLASLDDSPRHVAEVPA